MVRDSQDMPVWRVGATVLAAFALGVQVMLSAFLIGQSAWAAAQSTTQISCAHDPAGLVDDADGSVPGSPDSHDFCPACACPQSEQPLVALPPSHGVALPLPRSEVLAPRADIVGADVHCNSPYASRAPPRSA